MERHMDGFGATRRARQQQSELNDTFLFLKSTLVNGHFCSRIFGT